MVKIEVFDDKPRRITGEGKDGRPYDMVFIQAALITQRGSREVAQEFEFITNPDNIPAPGFYTLDDGAIGVAPDQRGKPRLTIKSVRLAPFPAGK